jgi:hypothetical protein
MAGKSTRFPNTRPKWMLSHPGSNRFMGIESITGLNLDFFEKIYFICLKEHENQYQFLNGFETELKKIGIGSKTEIILLEEETGSQSETVFVAIKKRNITGFVFVKDSDNYFEVNLTDQNNQICYFDLNKKDGINARNKSYLELDTNGIVSNIVEKKIISSNFSVGGYGFSSAEEFCKTYENLKDIEILKRAVAYQSAYMENNEDIVYEQMAVSTTGQNDAYTTFRNNDTNSPWIAPLAVIVCGKLSFMKARSVYTGKNALRYKTTDWTLV